MVYPYLYPVQMGYGVPSPRHPVSTVRITLPTVEPVTLAEAKAQLRIMADFTDDDSHVTGLVAAARRLVEQRLGQPLMATQFRATFADPLDLLSNRHEANWWGWSDTLELPYAPLLVGNSYPIVVTSGGVTLDGAAYTVDSDSRPSRIRLASPSTNAQVVVTYWAGAATVDAVQPTIKAAIKMLVGHWWLHRESVVVGTTNSSLDQGLDMLLASETLTGLY